MFRGDHGHGQAIFQFRVHRRAHDDLRAFAVAADLFHHAVDLGHGQIFAARQAHQHGVGFRQRAAFIQQRMREQFFHDFARTGRAGGFDKGKRAFGMAVADERAQIVEMNLNQAGAREQLPDAAHAFDEQSAGDAERVEHARVFVNELERFLVRQADDAVGDGFQLFQTLLRLLLAAVAFARKRQRDKRQHERAGFLGRAGQHGADAAARAAAKTGNDENDIRAFAGGFERGKLFLGDGAAAFGIAAGAKAAQQFGFEMNFHRRGRGGERRRIGIDGRKICAGKFLAVQRVEQG